MSYVKIEVGETTIAPGAYPEDTNENTQEDAQDNGVTTEFSSNPQGWSQSILDDVLDSAANLTESLGQLVEDVQRAPRHLTIQIDDPDGNRSLEINGYPSNNEGARVKDFGKLYAFGMIVTNSADIDGHIYDDSSSRTTHGGARTGYKDTVGYVHESQKEDLEALIRQTVDKINEKDLTYTLLPNIIPTLIPGIISFGPQNSNALAATVLRVIGVPESVIEDTIDGWAPGFHNYLWLNL